MSNEYKDEMNARRREYAAELDADDAREAERDARLDEFNRGRCSLRAAYAGGTEYEAELREAAAQEEADRIIAQSPVFSALDGWLAGYTVIARAQGARKAA